MPHRAWIRNSSSGLSLLWGTLGAKATSLKSPSNLGSPAPSVSVANVGRDERPDTRQSPCPVGSLKHKVRQDDLRSTWQTQECYLSQEFSYPLPLPGGAALAPWALQFLALNWTNWASENGNAG